MEMFSSSIRFAPSLLEGMGLGDGDLSRYVFSCGFLQ